MDKTAFLLACQEVLSAEPQQQGIGTLGEKTLHAVLKRYLEPRVGCHEVRTGPYVADIRNESGFVEIQTRSFDRLREKLAFFLDQAPVTVVYPVPEVKWVVWLEEDGVCTPRRKSPKRATACEILPELYKIKPLLGRENLRFCVVLLEVEEYRRKDGWSEDGKRGSTRFERFPVSLLDQVWLDGPEGYRGLIPAQLPEEFTGKEFGRASRLSPKRSWAALNVLLSVGAVERAGKRKNAYVYRRAAGLDHLSDVVAGA